MAAQFGKQRVKIHRLLFLFTADGVHRPALNIAKASKAWNFMMFFRIILTFPVFPNSWNVSGASVRTFAASADRAAAYPQWRDEGSTLCGAIPPVERAILLNSLLRTATGLRKLRGNIAT